MDYRDFSVEDLVLDSFFRSWVKFRTPPACEFWEQWIADHPHRLPVVEEARELVLGLEFTSDEPSAGEIREVKDRLISKLNTTRSPGKKRRAFRGGKSLLLSYPTAAVLAFLLLASLAVIYLLPSQKINIETTFGETRNITLPDGSRVTLNANSKISYARNWEAGKGREVWLEGEAFFEIRKLPQSARPEFYVQAGDLGIKVLGTSFNVYRRAGKTSVVLQEGSVELHSKGKTALPEQLLMRPGDKVDVEGSRYKIEKVAVEPYLSWRTHRMVFENTRLSSIARLLEDNYGYRVVFKDRQLENLRFTGSYSAKRVDVFLKALSEAFNIRVTVTDKLITIQ